MKNMKWEMNSQMFASFPWEMWQLLNIWVGFSALSNICVFPNLLEFSFSAFRCHTLCYSVIHSDDEMVTGANVQDTHTHTRRIYSKGKTTDEKIDTNENQSNLMTTDENSVSLNFHRTHWIFWTTNKTDENQWQINERQSPSPRFIRIRLHICVSA